MQKSLANAKEHKEKTKAENETAVMWPGQAADDWLLCRMVIGWLKNGQRAQAEADGDEMEAERGIVGRMSEGRGQKDVPGTGNCPSGSPAGYWD